MQTKLIITFFTLLALLGSALYINNYDSQEQSLQAYEEDIDFTDGHLYWNLSQKNLDSQQIRAIARSISRNKLQQWVGTEIITSIHLNLSKNTQTLVFRPILDAINQSLSKYLLKFTLDISQNNQYFDSNFNSYSFPENVKELKIVANNNKEATIQNISESISKQKSLNVIFLDFFNCYLNNAENIMVSIYNTKDLLNLSLQLGKNINGIQSDAFEIILFDLLKNKTELNEINLGFQGFNFTDVQLNDMEEILYPKLTENEYKTFYMDILSNGLAKEKVDQIFQDLNDAVGDRFQYDV